MDSSLSLDDIVRMAALARVALTDDEKERFARQVAEILGYARQVQRIDTTGVPPTAHTLVPREVYRDDTPQPSLPRDEVMAAAPGAAREVGLFRVPKVIGG